MPKEDTQFKPGNPGGPGRPKLTEREKAVREALRSNIAEVTDLLNLPLDEAKSILAKKDSTLLHQIFAQAINKKDSRTIEQMFVTRTLGAPKQTIEQTNRDGNLEESMTKEQKKKALLSALKELESDE